MILTDKEKKIVLIKYIIHGLSPFSDEPLETRVKMLVSVMGSLGWQYDEAEMLEIGQSILDFQGVVNGTLTHWLSTHTSEVVHAHTELEKGNDSLTSLGKDFVDKAKNVFRDEAKK